MTTLLLLPGQDHLEKVAASRDPLQGIRELVWNALDADALLVEVELDRNPLGGLSAIRVRDDGSGISPGKLTTDFQQLGDSWKKRATRTPKYKRALHGKEGRGRLRFFSAAGSASWSTVYEDDLRLWAYTARIRAAQLGRCDFDDKPKLIEEENASTGTTVELTALKDTLDWLTGQEAFAGFSATFAPYVKQYPNVRIIYNGEAIDPSVSIGKETELPISAVPGLERALSDLRVKLIEWNGQIKDRRIYFGSDEGIALASQPANVTAPGFEFSAYAYSKFFERMHEHNLLEMGDLTDNDLARTIFHIRSQLTDYFRERQSEETAGLIEELKKEGSYPYEGEPKSEVEVRERQVFNIATYAVSSYQRDFKKADPNLKRFTLAMMREAMRHNPESITQILRAVLGLPKQRQDEFSSLLEKTELGNIISAASLIADRVTVLQLIKEMVFDPVRRISTKERGELDALVQANTWIFGERFHLSLPEAGLSRVMQRVAQDLGHGKRRGQVRKPNGEIGRADVFLGRVIPHPDHDRREYLLVELKRPNISVGRKEFDQVENYATAIISQPEFQNTETDWNFFLMTTDVDHKEMHRVKQENREPGLFLALPRAKVWVKTWSEVLRQAESRIHFVQQKLQIEVTADEIESRLEAVRSSILRQKADVQVAA